jgi:hypothetical protein
MKNYRKIKEFELVNTILNGLSILKLGSFDRINNVPTYNIKTQSYNRPSKWAPKGMSDIIGCYNGNAVYIEVKTPIEYNWTMKFYNRLTTEFKVTIDNYQPLSKKEEHILNQIKYIRSKIKVGAVGFFTYGLDHVLEKLKEIK